MKEADKLVAQFMDQEDVEIQLFHDQYGEGQIAYFEIMEDRKHLYQIDPVNSKETEIELAHTADALMDQSVTTSTINTAQNLLNSRAIKMGRKRNLSVRITKFGDYIYYDLGDSRAVRISENDYSLIDDVPILFRGQNRDLNEPQEEPVPFDLAEIEDLWQLKGFLNIGDEDQKTLFILHVASMMIPDIDVPASILHGAYGSGKSRAMIYTKRLIEPVKKGGELERGKQIKNVDEFEVNASQTRLLCLDNLSRVSEEIQDSLSVYVTGGRATKRKLFTDTGRVQMYLRGIAMLSGLSNVVTKPDLLNRSLIFNFPSLTESTQIEESELDATFKNLKPRILGAIYKTISCAIPVYRELKNVSVMNHCGDWQRWLTAIASVHGISGDEIRRILRANKKLQNEQAIDESPVAGLVIEFMSGRDSYSGSTSDLYDDLGSQVSELPRNFPKNPNSFGRKVREVQTDLINEGFEIEFKRTNKKREIVITRISEVSEISSLSSLPSPYS